ncbi:MAG: helix-turn-helix domain-containing protein [Cyclobacteriaceae bacterium]
MSILFVIASIGVINGLLVGAYLLIRKERRVAEVYFAGLLLALSIRIGKSIYFYFGTTHDRLLLQIGLSACIFIGPFFYLYSKAQLRGEDSFKRTDLGLLVGLLVIMIVVGVLYPYTTYPDVWNGIIIYVIYGTWVIFALAGFYYGAQGFLGSKGTAHRWSDSQQYQLAIMLAMLFITITYMTALFFGIAYIWGAVIFTVVFYYLAGRLLLTSKPAIPKSTPVALENGAQLLAQVDRLMKEEKPYLDQRLKLEELATQAGMTKHQLSRVLNEEYQHGFSRYIKAYRVEEAKQLIASRHELSLEGIGFEAGFSSKSAFFEAFKKLEGSTPAQYKKARLKLI